MFASLSRVNVYLPFVHLSKLASRIKEALSPSVDSQIRVDSSYRPVRAWMKARFRPDDFHHSLRLRSKRFSFAEPGFRVTFRDRKTDGNRCSTLMFYENDRRRGCKSPRDL